jgi:hypothetical protein
MDHETHTAIERLEAGQRLALKMLSGQIDVVADGLRKTQRQLLALGAVLVRRGILTEDVEAQWRAAAQEIATARSAEEASDSRRVALNRLFDRVRREEVPEDEFNRLLREAMRQGDDQSPPAERA